MCVFCLSIDACEIFVCPETGLNVYSSPFTMSCAARRWAGDDLANAAVRNSGGEISVYAEIFNTSFKSLCIH